MKPKYEFSENCETKFPKELHHVFDKETHSCPASCCVRKLGSYVVGSVYSLAGTEGAFDFVSIPYGLDHVRVIFRRGSSLGGLPRGLQNEPKRSEKCAKIDTANWTP